MCARVDIGRGQGGNRNTLSTCSRVKMRISMTSLCNEDFDYLMYFTSFLTIKRENSAFWLEISHFKNLFFILLIPLSVFLLTQVSFFFVNSYVMKNTPKGKFFIFAFFFSALSLKIFESEVFLTSNRMSLVIIIHI